MNYGEIKTLIADYLDRDDLTAKIPTFIKLATTNLERDNNYRHMLKKANGSLTDDYFTLPSDYKEAEALFITANDREYTMQRTGYYDLIKTYPLGDDEKTIPKVFAYLDSKFYLRPYPDSTYPYTLIYYAYSAALSADEDTNWWTTTGYDILLFTALLEATPYLDYSDAQIALWNKKKAEAIAKLHKTTKLEVISGSRQVISMPRKTPFDIDNC